MNSSFCRLGTLISAPSRNLESQLRHIDAPDRNFVPNRAAGNSRSLLNCIGTIVSYSRAVPPRTHNRVSHVKKSSSVLICSLLAVCSAALVSAQTFEIGGEQQQHANTPSSESTKKNVKSDQKNAKPDQGSGGQLGWGSSIEVGRNARAAEDALRRGNPSTAADFAARAVKAAPQDAKLWFLLGYTSRLAGRFEQSLQAYDEGLRVRPGRVGWTVGEGADLRSHGPHRRCEEAASASDQRQPAPRE